MKKRHINQKIGLGSGEFIFDFFICTVFLLTVNVTIYSQPRVDPNNASSANYLVRMSSINPPKLSVTAVVPINGNKLSMDSTRPCNLAEICKNGWTSLIRNLQIKDEADKPVEVKNVGASGWELAESKTGRLKIEYEADYSLLAQNNFVAPREAAFADANHFSFVGRSVFISTSEVKSITVNFDLPKGWNIVAPWKPIKSSKYSFSVPTVNDLTENLLVMSRGQTQIISVEGFRLSIVPMGYWEDVSGEVKQVLQKVIPVFIRLMGVKENVNYSLVLLPVPEDENTGESYRSSFAFSSKSPPTKANREVWGQFIGHEIFHYWNGWRLQGEEYAASQWFQEGFTQYVADLAMAASGLFTEDRFRERIAGHIENYQKLTTSLKNPGSRKGPPLYSGGALVALCWDIQIRHATDGKRNLGDFLRSLWQETDNARRSYEWSDIKTALEKTAPLDWERFFLAYVEGTEKLPLDEIFRQAGRELIKDSNGATKVEISPTATVSSKSLWNSLIKAR